MRFMRYADKHRIIAFVQRLFIVDGGVINCSADVIGISMRMTQESSDEQTMKP